MISYFMKAQVLLRHRLLDGQTRKLARSRCAPGRMSTLDLSCNPEILLVHVLHKHFRVEDRSVPKVGDGVVIVDS